MDNQLVAGKKIPIFDHIVENLYLGDIESVDYSNEIDADMIAIAHYSEKIIAQLDNFTQNIITNKKQTPVLIIKGIEATVGSF